jgi:hypothetical protein
VDPTGEFAATTALAVVAVATFGYQAYKAIKTGDESTQYEKKLYDEYDKGFPNPEYAEKLKENRDKSYPL